MATRRAFGGLPQERALWAGFAQPGVCPVRSSAVPSGRHAAPWLVCAPTAPWGDMGDSSSPASPRAPAGFGHQWALLVALRVGQRQPCPEGGTRVWPKRGSASSGVSPVFGFPYHVPLSRSAGSWRSLVPNTATPSSISAGTVSASASAPRAEDGERGPGLPAAAVPCPPGPAPCAFLLHLIVHSCPIHSFDSPAPGS